MSKKWFSGPPPSVGWWPASSTRAKWGARYRWWNGSRWSVWASDSDGPEKAGLFGMLVDPFPGQIEWQHRPDSWPERSKT